MVCLFQRMTSELRGNLFPCQILGVSKLNTEFLYLNIQLHPWRRLKTKGSARQLPLVGSSLEVAQRLVINALGEFAFPRYCDDMAVKANSVSGSLNKCFSQRGVWCIHSDQASGIDSGRFNVPLKSLTLLVFGAEV